jgi:hypothetical protein
MEKQSKAVHCRAVLGVKTHIKLWPEWWSVLPELGSGDLASRHRFADEKNALKTRRGTGL